MSKVIVGFLAFGAFLTSVEAFAAAALPVVLGAVFAVAFVVVYGKDCALSKEWNINGEKVNLGVEKN